MPLRKNFSYSTVATPPSPATSGTSVTVQAGDGTKFTVGPVTIWPPGVSPLTTNAEVAIITAIATDTFTIIRAAQQTTAQSVTAGWQIANTVTIASDMNLNVFHFGAKGDVKNVADGVITTGTPNLTSATANWTAADVGKNVYVIGAGAAAGILSTTISAFVSSTAITLAANASTSVASSGTVYWGTDDTSAFNTALATMTGPANSQSVKVYVPAGAYLIDGTITPANGSSLVGEGIDSTTLVKCHATQAFITMSAGSAVVSDMTLYNQATPTAGSAINVTATNCVIKDINMNASFVGIEVGSGGTVCHMDRIYLSNYVSIGLYVHDTNDVFISNFSFLANNLTNGAVAGIRLFNKVQAFMAINGDIVKGAYGMTMDATVNAINVRPEYNQFINVDFDSSDNGCVFNNSNLTKFTNCWFSTSANASNGHGVSLQTVNDFTFSNSMFCNNKVIGLVIGATATHTKVFGCSVISNNVGASGQPGIYCASNVTDFSIIGCTCTNGGGFAGAQAWGINVGAGTSDRYSIMGNLVSGNATGGITDSGTGTNKVVQDQSGNFLLGLEAQYTSLTATYTLTSQTALQKLFNSTTNGAYNVFGATTYYFECEFDLSSMSASSGGFTFGFGGTATLTSLKYTGMAAKAAIGTASAALITTATVATATTLATANTTTTGHAYIKGIVRINAGGTLIPQVGLGVAAAAVVGVNSWFRITPVGSNTTTNTGNWT